MEGVPLRAAVQDPGYAAAGSLLGALAGLLDAAPRLETADRSATALMLLGLLERFPDLASGTRYAMDDETVVEAMAQVVERGFMRQ